MRNQNAVRPLIVAHRGACGYVPEHTLVAKAMAHVMGADAIEQDLVATKDHQVIVLHDIHLGSVTDVATRFPDRQREDGRYYTLDFTLDEIQSLHVFERFDPRTGDTVFPGRYPKSDDGFRIASFDEEIRFTQNLNRTLKREVAIYPEIKSPAFHIDNGCDLTKLVTEILKRHGYTSKDDACWMQCFDENQNKRAREELGYEGKLVQLIKQGHDVETGTDFNRMRSLEGLKDVAEYADGIGPRVDSIVTFERGKAIFSDLVEFAHRFDLQVCPWTVRSDALPSGCDSIEMLVESLREAGVDGMFTDQPDQIIQLLG